ncbi:MAG: hypothetical protein WCE44_07540 [Candidatus Velthaea sp.]
MIRTLLGGLGALCILAGLALFALGFAARPVGPVAVPPPPASALPVVGPYAPAMSTAVYAQNDSLSARVALRDERTLTYRIATRFTERLAIGFDRPVAACDVSQANSGRALHIFSLATLPGYEAIAFFSTSRFRADGTTIRCTLAGPISALRTEGAALAPADPTVARFRLEYAAHANLLHAPRAQYPAHDPSLHRVSLGLEP